MNKLALSAFALLLLCGCGQPEPVNVASTNVTVLVATNSAMTNGVGGELVIRGGRSDGTNYPPEPVQEGFQPKTDRERMFFEDGTRWGFMAVTRGGSTTIIDVVPRAYEMKREGIRFNREQEKQLSTARTNAP